MTRFLPTPPRLPWRRWEMRAERTLLGAAMSVVARIADFFMARRLGRLAANPRNDLTVVAPLRSSGSAANADTLDRAPHYPALGEAGAGTTLALGIAQMGCRDGQRGSRVVVTLTRSEHAELVQHSPQPLSNRDVTPTLDHRQKRMTPTDTPIADRP